MPTPRALVVDDDVSIRILVTRILEGRRFIVDTANDGAEAIQKLAAASYAVILLDLMMPRLDGIGVVKFLAEYHPDQLASVIVMTAFGRRAGERLPSPPVRLIEKPFDIHALVAEVRACMDDASAQHDGGA